MSDVNTTIISYRDPRSPSSEAYRMLRTNLQFSSPDKPIRSILVTSCTPNEGKSTTTSNLAVTFAQAGKKVLLIDADMRKPTVHKVFGMHNSAGLSNLIVNDGNLAGCVRPTWVDNLNVVSSGPIPPNPAELLSSKRSKEIIEKFEEEYDIVLIDSPPIAAVSDAVILSTFVSGTLLVVDYGSVSKDLAKKVVDQLRNVKANLLGVVLNRVPQNGNGYYYYEYGADA